MKAFRFYISLLIFSILTSCQPEDLPPSTTDDPKFSVTGGVVDISAGEQDFYLFSEYKKDALDVYSFIARFAKLSDCTSDCEEELMIEIRDVQPSPGSATVNIDQALMTGNYSYKISTPSNPNDLVVLDLSAEPEGTGPFLYKWTIIYNNDIDSFITTNPDSSLTFQNNVNASSLSVCLTIASNSCEIDYCNTIYLNNNTPGCQADFSVFNFPALSQLVMEADTTSGTSPFTFLWSNGSTDQTISQNHNGGLNETFCLTITDATGCTNEICKEVILGGGTTIPTICASRFSYEKTILPGGVDSLQLRTVFIQYTDPDGKVYRSDFQQQSNTSSFVISSVEDYEDNENGDKTKKLIISGNCVLYDENNNPLDFPFEGVIAVAYPR